MGITIMHAYIKRSSGGKKQRERRKEDKARDTIKQRTKNI
jgi:hypothetical protein